MESKETKEAKEKYLKAVLQVSLLERQMDYLAKKRDKARSRMNKLEWEYWQTLAW